MLHICVRKVPVEVVEVADYVGTGGHKLDPVSQ